MSRSASVGAEASQTPDESTNVKWMYEGSNSTIDREQYLLGKRISKVPEDKGDFLVEKQTNPNLSVSVLERLDYESKVREDPLFSIRKKEDEKRRELLSNPIKRKRLQSALKNALIKDLETSRKRGKKRTKKHKKGRSRSSSDSTDSDASSSEDAESSSSEDEKSKKLVSRANEDEKLHAALKKALEKDLKSHRKSVSSDSESDHKMKKKKKQKKERRNDSKHIHAKSHKKKHKRRRSSERSSATPDREKLKRDKEADRRAGYGLIVVKPRDESTAGRHRKRRTPTPPPVKEKYVRKERSGFTRKLNKEDLEKKRREMMANADWRDEQRRKNVESYSKEEKLVREREEEVRQIHDHNMRRDGKVKNFLHDMRLKQASGGSLEDTVRRKRHTLDRSSND